MNRSTLPKGWDGFAHDWAADQKAFKGMSWGKAMMWIFLLSDTFIFSCLLISLLTGRASTAVSWPDASVVFGLEVFGVSVPLLLIAI
ncbi:MAG: bb3-type cytochrome oxidase subunit IV, partial [Candidatus Marinimicrobia bacterium]|nr:bb3-type cytochrome oxidase subunit IV [Candidatus Neomarinimicrobiota bacterium]